MSSPSPFTFTVSTVHVGYARLLLQCLAHAGVELRSVFGHDDIASLMRLGAHARMPIDAWDGMATRVQSSLGDVDVALKLAEFVRPMDMGALGFITMASGNLRESAQALARFYPLLSDAYALDVSMIGRQLLARLQPLTSFRSQHLERFTLGVICRHSRWLAGRGDLRFDASFAFPHPGAGRMGQYRDTFGGCLFFSAQESVLCPPAGAEKLGVSRDDQGVKELLGCRLATEIASLGGGSSNLLVQVEHALRRRMAAGEVRIEDVAFDLGMSVRTLQVRMKEMGLSFREMFDRVRHGQALTLVGESKLPLTEIATELGFASQSSFARAFQRWTGMSPGRYRQWRP